jgi:hypothetical protein
VLSVGALTYSSYISSSQPQLASTSDSLRSAREVRAPLIGLAVAPARNAQKNPRSQRLIAFGSLLFTLMQASLDGWLPVTIPSEPVGTPAYAFLNDTGPAMEPRHHV